MALELVVVTPQGQKFAGPVEEVVLPGANGEFGVLESHERLLSALDHGVMTVKMPEGNTRYAALSDGFAEITGEKVVVLVDSSLEVDEIDVEEAQREHKDITEKLAALKDGDEDAGHRADLENIQVRLAVQLEVAQKNPVAARVGNK